MMHTLQHDAVPVSILLGFEGWIEFMNYKILFGLACAPLDRMKPKSHVDKRSKEGLWYFGMILFELSDPPRKRGQEMTKSKGCGNKRTSL